MRIYVKKGKVESNPAIFFTFLSLHCERKKMTKNVRFFLLFPEKPYICRLKMNQEQINY